jgi:hypothetical protein
VAETERYERPAISPQKGEAAREARIRLARKLLESVGAPPDVAEAGAGDAADDPHFLDDVVASLVDDGVVALARLPERRANEEELDRALLGPAFSAALDRRRGNPAGPRERARLGRLYALAGEVEKAASCYREVLDERAPVPLSLVSELARVAARAGEQALSLGAVDRIAEVVLTGDAGQDKSPEDATVAGTALERAAAVALELGAAPRAAALARAAVLIFERAGLRREAQRALGPLGRALLATNDRPGAWATFDRWRALSVAQGDLAQASRALEVAAEAFLAHGDLEAAADWLEQAADVLASAGEKHAAARSGLRAGELRAARGDLGAAGIALERARAYAAGAGDSELESAIRISLARARVAEGQLGAALREAEAALNDRESKGDAAGAADARVALATACLAAGDPEGARAHLASARDHSTAAGGAFALELRAELALLDGREDDAQAHLADAGRLHALDGRDTDSARTAVRRAELALAAGDVDRASTRLSALSSLEAPELVTRTALLEARLAGSDEVKRSALDRAFDLAYSKDYHAQRVAAAIARASARLASGKVELAAADARAALETVRDARKSLPDDRKARYLAAAGRVEVANVGKAVRDALAGLTASGAPPTEDQTGGLESSLNALDVLLGLLASPTG